MAVIQVRVDDKLLGEVDERAVGMGLSRSGLVRMLLTQVVSGEVGMVSHPVDMRGVESETTVASTEEDEDVEGLMDAGLVRRGYSKGDQLGSKGVKKAEKTSWKKIKKDKNLPF